MKYLAFIVVVLLSISACNTPSQDKKFVDIVGIDSALSPGDNFFQYVNGIWYDTAQNATLAVRSWGLHVYELSSKAAAAGHTGWRITKQQSRR